MLDPSTARGGGMVTGEEVVKGRYSLQAVIGKGGNAVVYTAKDAETDALVAVKRISLQNGTPEELLHEIDILKSLDHPNIIKYLDDFKSDNFVYIVMPYAEKGSLLTNIKREGNMTEAAVVSYVQQVLSGLAYLHRKCIIHRDVKAGNVLLTGGKAKLSDFGLAMTPVRDDKEEHHKHLVGSVYWMAPEAIKDQLHNEATDVWALGCTVVELLTGVPPFFDRAPVNALYHIVESDETPIPEATSDLCRSFLMACLSRDPKQRWSAEELLDHEWLGGTLKVKPPPRGLVSPDEAAALSSPTDGASGGASGAPSAASAGGGGGPKDGSGGGGGEGSLTGENAATWTENLLFDTTPAKREAWLRGGGLKKAVTYLTTITAEQAFQLVRGLAYAAKRFPGTEETFFFDALGQTTLWEMDLTVLGTPEDISTLFAACCAFQDTHVQYYAPSQEAALNLLLRVETHCRACASALRRATSSPAAAAAASPPAAGVGARRPSEQLLSGMDLASEDPNHAAAACQRLRRDNAHLVLQRRVEEVALNCLRTKQDPAGGWAWIDDLVHVIVAVVGSHDEAPLLALLSDKWLVTVSEVSRHQCPSAIALLVRYATLRPARIGSVLKVGPFLHVAADPGVDYRTRVAIMRCLPLLQQSPAAAAALCEPSPSVALLVHILQMVPLEAEEDELLEVAVALCRNEAMACACGSYSKFLVVLNAKLQSARVKNNNANAQNCLRLFQALFRHTLRPEHFTTSSELTKNLAALARAVPQQRAAAGNGASDQAAHGGALLSNIDDATREEAGRLLDALAAQAKML